MTTAELRELLNNKYGIDKKWPATFTVDPETYANVCQDIFRSKFELEEMFWDTVKDGKQMPDTKVITVALGAVNQGIMFKNVELILKSGGQE